MRKILFLVFLMGLAVFPLPAGAQQSTPTIAYEIPVTMAETTILRSGPGENSLWVEYIAPGIRLLAQGRNQDGSWLEVNYNGQVAGWVPTAIVQNLSDIPFNNLAVKGGLLASGEGLLSPADPLMRQAQVQLILVQRPMLVIGARYFRLQGYLGASCLELPTATPPGLSTATPETARIQRELNYVFEETQAAIQKYSELCTTGGDVGEQTYIDGLARLNNAYNAWNVVRRYVEELTGMTFVVS